MDVCRDLGICLVFDATDVSGSGFFAFIFSDGTDVSGPCRCMGVDERMLVVQHVRCCV